MINVIVSYTISKDFVISNKRNIKAFLKDFNNFDQSQFSYRVLIKENGETFVHISKYSNEIIQKELLNIPSFLEFQKQRDESRKDIGQKIEAFTFLGSSGDF